MTEGRDVPQAVDAAEVAVPTVIEEAERHPPAARELAAARLAANVGAVLNSALRHRGWPARRLAHELNVGESAVSQVLNSDGNLRVATIARYARALGFQAKIVLEPVEPGLMPLAEAVGRRRAGSPGAVRMPRVTVPDSGWRMVDTGGRLVIETVTPSDPESTAVHQEFIGFTQTAGPVLPSLYPSPLQ
jgi:transcriptional regulator with XRE-family HTH domain